MKAGKIISGILKTGAVAGLVGGIAYYDKKKLDKQVSYADRYKNYYQLTKEWVTLKQDNKNIEDWFKNNNINTIAIYGLGTMAELLYNEIKGKIKVANFIDKNSDELYRGLDNIPVVAPSDIVDAEGIDAIIITPVYDFDAIRDELETLGVTQTIKSLEDVIYEI